MTVWPHGRLPPCQVGGGGKVEADLLAYGSKEKILDFWEKSG
jgi:hypothetical protein